MDSIFYKYLITHGITNIVDIDGLLYCPISDVEGLFGDFVAFGLVGSWLIIGLGCLIHDIVNHYWPQEN